MYELGLALSFSLSLSVFALLCLSLSPSLSYLLSLSPSLSSLLLSVSILTVGVCRRFVQKVRKVRTDVNINKLF